MWAFLILVFVLVLLLLGAGLVYLTAVHPSLAAPLTAAAAGITVVFTTATVAIAAISTSSKRH
ncbi:hypothetical protein C0216_30970 (plasmid) [Streptomyces globosus]|uniref:Uncharacterized protein n=1 Tax=Streptomyces globosus TaxID=68209 RepID=A0A344UAK5_9ACTN|nr:hypothetical protein C0216_30970 [Streptomyces globosus]